MMPIKHPARSPINERARQQLGSPDAYVLDSTGGLTAVLREGLRGNGPLRALDIVRFGGLAARGQSALLSSTSLSGELQVLKLKSPYELDTSFGAAGVAAAGRGSAGAVALLPDGRVLVLAAQANNVSVLARLLPNGTLDTSFGSQGISPPLDLGQDGDTKRVGRALAVGPNGEVVVTAVGPRTHALARISM
jgi:hypothetical protein